MSTANFETMRDFPLYAKDYDDDYDSYIEVPLIEEDLADINYDLMFHKIQVKGGYYCGIQLYVEVEHDLEEEDYSNDDCHYYFDCCKCSLSKVSGRSAENQPSAGYTRKEV